MTHRLSDTTETYGPDGWLVGLWLLITGIPALLSIWVLVRDGMSTGALEMMCVGIVLPLSVAVFAFRFRVTFTSDTFVYRRWGPTIHIPYDEIARIEVANATPIAKQAVGAFIVTRHGERLPFWPKLFPQRVVTRFFQLAKLVA